MKKEYFVMITLLFGLFTMLVCSPGPSIAQTQNAFQLSLPEGAKARFGNGIISGNIAYSPDGTLLAVAGTIGIWIYDAQTGEALDLLTGHDWEVQCISFSWDGETLASGSNDYTVRLWDVETGEHIRSLKMRESNVYDVSFSLDGRVLASVYGYETVDLWDVGTGEHLRTLTGHSWGATSLLFSPDGITLASASSKEEIHLWNAERGTLQTAITSDNITPDKSYFLIPNFSFSSGWWYSGNCW